MEKAKSDTKRKWKTFTGQFESLECVEVDDLTELNESFSGHDGDRLGSIREMKQQPSQAAEAPKRTVDKHTGNLSLTSTNAESDMGDVLYELKYDDYSKNNGEDVLESLTFYEHVVVKKGSTFIKGKEEGYKMTVIPRFKIVNARVSASTGTKDLPRCCGLFVDWSSPVTENPPIYYISLDVRHNTKTVSYGSSINVGDWGSVGGDGSNDIETTTIRFRCGEEAPNEPFLIQYVYGVLKNNDKTASAHMLSHQSTAATQTLGHTGLGLGEMVAAVAANKVERN